MKRRLRWSMPKAEGMPLLVGAGFVLLALLLGSMAGLGVARAPLLGLLGLPVFAALVLLGLREPSQRLLSFMLAGVFAVTLLHPLLDGALRLPVGYVFELLCFAWLLGSLMHALKHHGQHGALRWLLLALLAYALLGLLSSALGRSQWLAGVWQFQYNLKWPAMLLVGMLLSHESRQQRVLSLAAFWLWLPIAAFVALEIVRPGLHGRLLGLTEFDLTPNPLLGFGLRRQGPFPHSGYLALISAGLAWLALVQLLTLMRWRWLLPLLAYLGLLGLSGQRQELAALLGAVLLGLGLLLRRHWPMLLLMGSLTAGVALNLSLILDVSLAQQLIGQWGGGENLSQLSERYELTRAGLQIAREWFPLGSGLGTFGGAGAQKFDQSLFIEMGFEKFWWFRRGSFIVDTYWPSVLAEVGWLGGLLLALAFATLWSTLWRALWRGPARVDPSQAPQWMALGLLTLMLLNSPTSASISDPRSAFWMWLLVGAGFARAMRQSACGPEQDLRKQRPW